MTVRCSSLPALAECACFESEPSEYTGPGTERHAALTAALQGNDFLLEALEEEDAAGVRWALHYIQVHAKTAQHPLVCETTLSTRFSLHGHELTGTPDVACGLDIFDLKWRSNAEYWPQLAGYAFLRIAEESIAESQPITVHILHGAFQRVETRTFTLYEALDIILPIIEKAAQPGNQPNPCSFCKWCAKKATCPALNALALTVTLNREDWSLSTYHASEIEQPAEMAKALRIARKLKHWIKAVEYFALEMHIKRGVTIPDNKLQTKAGKSSCANMVGAFNATGLSANDFLACCEIRMGKDKKNPAKRGLIETFAKANGISEAEAKRRLKTKLQDHMRTAKESQFLQSTTEDEEETETIDA